MGWAAPLPGIKVPYGGRVERHIRESRPNEYYDNGLGFGQERFSSTWDQ